VSVEQHGLHRSRARQRCFWWGIRASDRSPDWVHRACPQVAVITSDATVRWAAPVLKSLMRRPPRTLAAPPHPRATPEPRWLVSSSKGHRIEFRHVTAAKLLTQVFSRRFRPPGSRVANPAGRGAAVNIVCRLPGPVADLWKWQYDGSCRREDPATFFHPEGERGPSRRHRDSAAQAVCLTCPVVRQCREHALRVREPYGVWGGMTESERESSYVASRGLSTAS